MEENKAAKPEEGQVCLGNALWLTTLFNHAGLDAYTALSETHAFTIASFDGENYYSFDPTSEATLARKHEASKYPYYARGTTTYTINPYKTKLWLVGTNDNGKTHYSYKVDTRSCNLYFPEHDATMVEVYGDSGINKIVEESIALAPSIDKEALRNFLANSTVAYARYVEELLADRMTE